jgi:Alanine dehydrogenase
MIAGMKPGAVVVDVAIDQGGCFETSHPTTHTDPVYVVDGVIHYCVANMPGAVPITSTKALTNATLPYVEAIADLGVAAAVAHDPALAKGVNAIDGSSRTRRSPMRTASSTRRSPTSCRRDGLARCLLLLLPLLLLGRRADPDDKPCDACRKRDHAGMKTASPRMPRIVSTAV